MTYGGKAGVLLALALGCSTRSLVLDLRGQGGHDDDVPSGQRGGTDGDMQRPCIPEDDDTAGRTTPIAFDGLSATSAPTLVEGRTTHTARSPGAIALADLDAD